MVPEWRGLLPCKLARTAGQGCPVERGPHPACCSIWRGSVELSAGLTTRMLRREQGDPKPEDKSAVPGDTASWHFCKY